MSGENNIKESEGEKIILGDNKRNADLNTKSNKEYNKLSSDEDRKINVMGHKKEDIDASFDINLNELLSRKISLKDAVVTPQTVNTTALFKKETG